MEFSLRCRCWSVLQVVAIIIACYRGKVSSERAQDCVGALLNLRCPEMKVIKVTDVVIGDSACSRASCCITDNDCTGNASASHTVDVHRRCDGKSSCTVYVIEEVTSCGLFGSWSKSDFERITYNCGTDSRGYITAPSTSVQLTTVTFTSAPDESGDEELAFTPHAAPGLAYSSANYGIVTILCVVCLIVIIAVVVSVSIVTVRRKKRRQVKSSNAIKNSDLETDRKKEAIYMNVNGQPVGTGLNENTRSSVPIYVNSGVRSLETRTSDYCEIEGVTNEGIQSDSQYEKLDLRRNYEPLIVYQQLR